MDTSRYFCPELSHNRAKLKLVHFCTYSISVAVILFHWQTYSITQNTDKEQCGADLVSVPVCLCPLMLWPSVVCTSWLLVVVLPVLTQLILSSDRDFGSSHIDPLVLTVASLM